MSLCLSVDPSVLCICNGELTLDEKLFASWTAAAERRLSEFNVQNVANTAWAFAAANHLDEKLFASQTAAAQRRLSEFNVQNVANMV